MLTPVQSSPDPWNSLEIVKLVADFATPLLLAFVSYRIFKLTNNIEQRQWANQKVVERRLDVFQEMAPRLNDLYCYFMWLGHWHSMTPEQIVEKKRQLDSCFYINAFLFSNQFERAYQTYIHTLFKTYRGFGRSPGLLTSIVRGGLGNRETEAPFPWDPRWTEHFVLDETHASRDLIRERYRILMNCFSDELGIKSSGK